MGTPGDKFPLGQVVHSEPTDTEPPPPPPEGPAALDTGDDMTVLQNMPSLGIFIEHDLHRSSLNLHALEDLEKQLLHTSESETSSSFVETLTAAADEFFEHASSSQELPGPVSFADLNLPGPSGLQTPKSIKLESIKIAPKRNKKPPISSQTPKKPHSCPVCQKNFQTSAKLTSHQLVHSGGTPFKCEHCKKSFSSKFKLVRHVLIHSDRKPFSCTVCERTFHRKDHLKNHIKVHSPSKKVYTCERQNCKKEYTSVMSFRKHLALHAAEEGSLECKICSKMFESKADILYHLKIHAGSRTVKNPNEKKFTCDYCDRKFFTRKDVRRHLVVHTGTRNFLCQFCPQRFGRKDHLVRHIKKSHSKNYSELESSTSTSLETPAGQSSSSFDLPESSESSSFLDIKSETTKLEIPQLESMDAILDYPDAKSGEATSDIKLEEMPEVQTLLFSRSFTELSPMLCSEPDQLQQFISQSSSEPDLPSSLPSDSELLTELDVMKGELEGGGDGDGGSAVDEPPLLMDSDLLRLISEGGSDESNLPLPGFSQVFKQQDPQPPS